MYSLQRNAVDASSPKALDSLNADAPPAVANGSGLGGSEPVLGGTSFSGGFSKARAAAVAPPMPDENPYDGLAGVLGAV